MDAFRNESAQNWRLQIREFSREPCCVLKPVYPFKSGRNAKKEASLTLQNVYLATHPRKLGFVCGKNCGFPITRNPISPGIGRSYAHVLCEVRQHCYGPFGTRQSFSPRVPCSNSISDTPSSAACRVASSEPNSVHTAPTGEVRPRE